MKKLILSVIMLTGLATFAQKKPTQTKGTVKTETTATKATTTTDTDVKVNGDGSQIKTATDAPVKKAETTTTTDIRATVPSDKKNNPAGTVAPE